MKKIQELKIANPCKWCDGQGWTMGLWKPNTCKWCNGTGDHDYGRNGVVTYERVTVGRIKE